MMGSREIEIKLSTPSIPGVAEGKVCGICDGEGLLDKGTSKKPEIIFCHGCDGRGGVDPTAIDLAREFSKEYLNAIMRNSGRILNAGRAANK
jgi:hypothetical protein